MPKGIQRSLHTLIPQPWDCAGKTGTAENHECDWRPDSAARPAAAAARLRPLPPEALRRQRPGHPAIARGAPGNGKVLRGRAEIEKLFKSFIDAGVHNHAHRRTERGAQPPPRCRRTASCSQPQASCSSGPAVLSTAICR